MFYVKKMDKSQILFQQLVALAQGLNITIMQFYNAVDIGINYKADQSPVTIADIASHKQITAALAVLTPHIPVLSEESLASQALSIRESWHTFWLVDPLDGTKEFIYRTDEFTVNIALISAGKIILSILSVPVTNIVYAAHADHGIYKIIGQHWQKLDAKSIEDAVFDEPLRIAISRRATEKEQQAYSCFFTQLDERHIAYTCIEAGSAYKFCLMAEGKVDLYPRLHPTSEWDTAAGQGILEALGGKLVTLEGKPFSYNKRSSLLNGSFIAVRSHTLLGLFIDENNLNMGQQ